MFVFVLDRFLCVFMPYFYPKHQIKAIVSLSVASWLYAIAASLIQLPQILDCLAYTQRLGTCLSNFNCSRNCTLLLNIIIPSGTVPATVIPIILYIILYMKARKIRKADRTLSTIAGNHESDWRATITFFLLFLSVFIVTLPTFTVKAIINLIYRSSEQPAAIYILSTICSHMIFLLPVTDPIVIMRNRDVKEIMKNYRDKMIHKWRPQKLSHSRILQNLQCRYYTSSYVSDFRCLLLQL